MGEKERKKRLTLRLQGRRSVATGAFQSWTSSATSAVDATETMLRSIMADWADWLRWKHFKRGSMAAGSHVPGATGSSNKMAADDADVSPLF